MNNDNIFDLMFDLVFTSSPKLVGLGLNPYYLLTSFSLQQGNRIPDFYLCTLHSCSKIIMVKEKTVQLKFIIGTYICTLSKPPFLQWYITNY